MSILVLRENLKTAISVVERATAKSPTLPILSAIAVQARKNELELAATDLEMGVRYRMLAKSEKEEGVAVSAKTLSQFITLLGEEQVQLEMAKEGLRVESKNNKTTIRTLPIEDFPIIPSLRGGEEATELDAKAFCAGLSQVVAMTGQAQARPEISGVYVALQKDSLRMAATDSFRLAEKTLALPGRQEKEESYILPQRTAREIIGILGEKPGKVKMYLSPAQALFEYEAKETTGHLSLQIVSRLIEGDYPQYQDVIPQEFATKAQVPKQEFVAKLRAASVFSGKMQDVKIAVDTKRHGLEISSQSSELGEHSSFLPAQLTGPPLEISFNWRFLLEGLSNIKGEEVEMGFGGEDAPVLLRPLSKDQYLYVLMPVKA